MSFSSINIEEVLNVFRSYMTCYDCKKSSVGVVVKSCSHLLCEKCSQPHNCNNSSEPLQICSMPPSLKFIKDLYEQLDKISSMTSKSSSTVKTNKDIRMTRKSLKRLHQTKMTNGHFEANQFNSAKKPSTADKENDNKQCKFVYADPDVLVTRYLPNGVEPIQAPNEMPILEREDNQNQDCIDKTRKPDTLDKCNGTLNSTCDDVEIIENSISVISVPDETEDEGVSEPKRLKHDSICPPTHTRNYIQRVENSSDSSLSSSEDRLVINESTSSSMEIVSTESLPGPSRITRIKEETSGLNFVDQHASEPYTFVGFREHDIDCCLLRYLRFKLCINQSICETVQAGSFEFTIRNLNIGTSSETSQENTEQRSQDIPNQITPESSICGSPERVPSLRDTSLVDDDDDISENGRSDRSPIPSFDRPPEECSSEKSLPSEGEGAHLYSSASRESKRQNKPAASSDCNGCYSLDSKKSESKKLKRASPSKKKNNNNRRMKVAEMMEALDKIILKEQNEELKKIEINEKKEKREDNVWLSTSGLSSQEQMLVIRLARLTKAKLSNCFSHETTHFIMGENTQENQDYLLAIAYGVNIVTIDWVVSCLDEEKIIDSTKFIHQTDEGPARCLDAEEKPFEGFYFFLGISPHPSHLDYDSYQVTKTLCYHGGAHIILDHDKFLPFIKLKKVYPRFFISISSDLTDEVRELCVKFQAVPIMHTWIFSCMRQYRPVPIFEFMYSPLSIYDSINMKRVPFEILGST